MNYEDIVELISNGQQVYAINESKDIIEGKVVSVVNYRESLSSNVNSNTPDIKSSETFNITLRLANGESEHVNEIFLTADDAKLSLNVEIDGEIKTLTDVLTKAGIESKVVMPIAKKV
jgi:hypothetical protein